MSVLTAQPHGFTYKHGDRPLDGFTIQRAAGRGGFGEVYYAVSDSGREVALKAVLGYEQIELRGISQCMNLKSPHLVAIFDVKHNEQGRPFVIMEFVSGPSLRQLLDESPGGLGTQKAAFFLREMAKGLTFLHDCGIVHRDLKPANIFYENGYVKIGDYGLSKAMACGAHSAQTVTVGTVHYMAPEIGVGRYDRGIDIYALGAVLFEMLTGQVPYLGASAGEILMKHMTAEPDVSGIEEPFATVIKRAMHKDPAQRYQNVQEMVEGIFGSEHVRNSVSCFSPEDLSMVAGRVARHVAAGAGGSSGPAVPPPPPGLQQPPPSDVWDRVGGWVDRAGDRLGAAGERVADAGARLIPASARRPERPADDARLTEDLEEPEIGDPLGDPMSKRQRRVLGLIVTGVIALVTGLFDPLGRDEHVAATVVTFLGAYATAFGLLLAHRRVFPHFKMERKVVRNLAVAGTAAVPLLIVWGLAAAAAGGRSGDALAGCIPALLVALLIGWRGEFSPSRPERILFASVFWTAVLGMFVTLPFGGSVAMTVGTLAAMGLLVQILSPWDPYAAKRKAELTKARGGQWWRCDGAPQWGSWSKWQDRARAQQAGVTPARNAPAAAPIAPVMRDVGSPAAAPPAAPTPPRPPAPPAWAAPAALIASAHAAARRPVPTGARYLWLAGFIAAVPFGVMLLVYAGMASDGSDEFAPAVGFGVGLLGLGVLCFVKMFQTAHRGAWRCAGRWLVMWACLQTAFVSLMFTAHGDLRGEDLMAAVFFMVFPLVLLPVVAFVRFTPAGATPPPIPAGLARNGGTPGLASMTSGASSPRRPSIVLPAIGKIVWAAGDLVLSLVIGAMLLLATFVGLSLAVDLPGMIAAGLPDPQAHVKLTREFGFDTWPGLLRQIGHVVGWVLMFTGLGLLTLARRRHGAAHMVRGAAAVLLFVGALGLFGIGLDGEWLVVQDHAGRVSVPASIERYVGEAERPALVVAAVTAVGALVLMGWPAKRRREGGADAPAAQPAPTAPAGPQTPAVAKLA